MCGRYSLTTPVEALRQLFDFPEQLNLRPRYNIAPTQEVAAVRRDPPPAAGARVGDPAGGKVCVSGRHLVLLRWGLIPAWAKEAAIGSRMINARAETLADKPAFRSAFRKRRCLIAADGFYEWRTTAEAPKAPKQPYYIRLESDAPFAIAGLWERWRDPAGATIESCTLITTEANPELASIHHRMPVILAPADYDAWLEPRPAAAEALHDLLRPYHGCGMTAIPIGRHVNNVRNDDPACIEALA